MCAAASTVGVILVGSGKCFAFMNREKDTRTLAARILYRRESLVDKLTTCDFPDRETMSKLGECHRSEFALCSGLRKSRRDEPKPRTGKCEDTQASGVT